MNSTSPKENIERVSVDSIRSIFNRSQYPRQIKNGTLLPEYVRNDHMTHPEKVGEPQCTHSQFIRYCNGKGRWLVEVHQYFRSKDKTLGGSGQPDPKRLRVANKIYIADKNIKEKG